MISRDSKQTRSEAAIIIARGGVIAFRTDTFYGLGADPFNRAAIQKIKQLKGREESKPILIIISDRQQLSRFIQQPSPTFDLLAKAFWPGALTLIGKARLEVPQEITAGTQTVGVRLPADKKVCALVNACGGALTATSANRSETEPAKTAQEVGVYFGEEIDLIVDDGQARSDRPSTVVDATETQPKLVRDGVISWSEIKAELKRIPIKT